MFPHHKHLTGDAEPKVFSERVSEIQQSRTGFRRSGQHDALRPDRKINTLISGNNKDHNIKYNQETLIYV